MPSFVGILEGINIRLLRPVVVTVEHQEDSQAENKVDGENLLAVHLREAEDGLDLVETLPELALVQEHHLSICTEFSWVMGEMV